MSINNSNDKYARWVKVQAYKHDGLLHRQWSPSYLVCETDDYWVLASKASCVTESDGRRWITKEKAVFILFKHKWMNVLAMFKENRGICYYVNVASPTILDKGYLKYIDYDLDVKLYPDGLEKTLDEKEYARHIQTYGYPKELSKAIEKSISEVRGLIKDRKFPFQNEEIERLYSKFLEENQPFRKAENFFKNPK